MSEYSLVKREKIEQETRLIEFLKRNSGWQEYAKDSTTVNTVIRLEKKDIVETKQEFVKLTENCKGFIVNLVKLK